MKLLITGSSGFLGSHLIARCGERYALAGLERDAWSCGGIEILSSADTEQLRIEPDAVIMCHAEVQAGGRAKGNDAMYESNVRLTERICQRFPDAFIVYLSTVSVYPPTGGLFTESSPCSPASPYAISKYWGEKVVAAHRNAAVLRVSSLYGPGMNEATLIPNYIRQARNHGEIVVWGNGGRLQNYLHVSDAVGYILALLRRPAEAAGKVFLGTGSTEHSNAEVAAMVARHTNARVNFVKQDSSPSCRYHNGFTRATTGYQPSIRLAVGLAELLSQKAPAGDAKADRRKRMLGKSARWSAIAHISVPSEILEFFALGARCCGFA